MGKVTDYGEYRPIGLRSSHRLSLRGQHPAHQETRSGNQPNRRYRRIEASIQEIGIIEPLVVYPQTRGTEQYILLDGHIRFEILKGMGQNEVDCLVAMDDEGITYNHEVNQVSAIQEHFMIMEAIRRGLSEERIAKTLNVDIAAIRRKRDLLDGICPEAVQLLKEKRACAGVFREMRRVKPMRQIEMAELMLAANSFSRRYAECLFAATPQEQLLEPDQPKDVRGLCPDDISRMEREMESLGQDYRLIEESHGRNVLNLVLVVGLSQETLGQRPSGALSVAAPRRDSRRVPEDRRDEEFNAE